MQNKNLSIALLLLRISAGGLMLFHGIAKLSHGVDGIAGMLSDKGLPGFIAYGVYIGEIIAPLLILIGFRTKIASVVFIINMLVAILLAHSGDVFSVSKMGGYALELHTFYILVPLALVFTGAGSLAVSNSHKWD